jgi:RimJ/RimL family protein N-acetyltransferase
VRLWRNQNLQYLRTPYLLTEEMQAGFYSDTVCNRSSDSRFWGIWADDKFIGQAGLVIQWENSIAEVSLILDKGETGKGYGEAALNLLLEQGFGNLNLHNICGECYECSGAVGFWKHMMPTYTTTLPSRKYWKGKYWDSLYFNFARGDA